MDARLRFIPGVSERDPAMNLNLEIIFNPVISSEESEIAKSV